MKRKAAMLLLALVGLALAWSPGGGGDHGGSDWTPTTGQVIGGYHYNIGTFSIPSGQTNYVTQYTSASGPSDTSGYVRIVATTISIQGTLDAQGRGYGGGGGGYGGIANGYQGTPGFVGTAGSGGNGGNAGSYPSGQGGGGGGGGSGNPVGAGGLQGGSTWPGYPGTATAGGAGNGPSGYAGGAGGTGYGAGGGGGGAGPTGYGQSGGGGGGGPVVLPGQPTPAVQAVATLLRLTVAPAAARRPAERAGTTHRAATPMFQPTRR